MRIIVVSSYQQGINRAKEILYEKVDRTSVLFLSGGKTPKELYTTLANEKVLRPGSVGMIDERYGKKFHPQSNETMMRDSGLLAYLQNIHVPFYPMLPKNAKTLGREEVARSYDRKTRELFFHFRTSVAVMGIGSDAHISSIIPNRNDFTNPLFEENNRHLLIGEFDDTNSPYQERIGMTFAGLSLIDYFLVLVFGKEKKHVLQTTFTPGSLEEVPARFFNQEAPRKTVIITDQII